MARSSKTNEARLKNFWRNDGHEDFKNIYISFFKKKRIILSKAFTFLTLNTGPSQLERRILLF